MGRHTLPSNRVGRHRYGRGDRIHCRELPSAREFFSMHPIAPRWLRFLRGERSRHSFAWFEGRGQTARPAFLLVMSL